MSNARPGWDEYFLRLAETAAERSPDAKRMVGCVLVDADRRIVATGYNGTPAGFDDREFDWWDKALKERTVIHAEANALLHADTARLRQGTLYCSYSPCIQCAKLIAGVGIRKVVFREVSDLEALESLALFGIEARKLAAT